LKILERQFASRPRILNALHALSLVDAMSQTYPDELALLSSYAAGASVAVEVGSFQGVSSALIAAALSENGLLYCVDPWPAVNDKADPSFAIFKRHLRRCKVKNKIRILRGRSHEVAERVPREVDFMFIDGDNSRDAMAFDWSLAKRIVRAEGYVCLHDALVPDSEPWRTPESSSYFRDVICRDPEFSLAASCHTLAVMRRA
jgi:predicted O-methyltransferase YrrM